MLYKVYTRDSDMADKKKKLLYTHGLIDAKRHGAPNLIGWNEPPTRDPGNFPSNKSLSKTNII